MFKRIAIQIIILLVAILFCAAAVLHFTLAEGALFLSQYGQQVYSRGPPCRYQASQQGNDQQ